MDKERLVKLANICPELRNKIVPILKSSASFQMAFQQDKDFEEGLNHDWPRVLAFLKAGNVDKIRKFHNTSVTMASVFLGSAIQTLNQHADLLHGKPWLLGSNAWHAEVEANLEKYSELAGRVAAAWAGVWPSVALRTQWHRVMFPGLAEWFSESKN